MTTVGENRRRYSREVEVNPSRFADHEAYRAWAARADAWAERQGLTREPKRPQPPSEPPRSGRMIRTSPDSWEWRDEHLFELEGAS